jgi:hypothetical protein
MNESKLQHARLEGQDKISLDAKLWRSSDYVPLEACLQIFLNSNRTAVLSDEQRRCISGYSENFKLGIKKLLARHDARQLDSPTELAQVASVFAGVVVEWLHKAGVAVARDLPRGYAYQKKENYSFETKRFEEVPEAIGSELFYLENRNNLVFNPRNIPEDSPLTGIHRRVTEEYGDDITGDGMRRSGGIRVDYFTALPETDVALRFLKDVNSGLLTDFTNYVEARQTINIDDLIVSLRQQWDSSPGQGNPVAPALAEYIIGKHSSKLVANVLRPTESLARLLIGNNASKEQKTISKNEAWKLLNCDWLTWQQKAGHLSDEAIGFLQEKCGYKKYPNELVYKIGAHMVSGAESSPSMNNLYNAFRAEPDIVASLTDKVPQTQLAELVRREKENFFQKRAKDFWEFMKKTNETLSLPSGSSGSGGAGNGSINNPFGGLSGLFKK